MRRRERAHETEDLDRWLISYADFITLLFAFFVVMYAVSSINVGKYKEVTESLVSAFQKVPRSLEPIQVGEISRDNKNDVIETPLKNAQGNTADEANNKNSLSFSEKADQIEKNMMELVKMDEITMRRSDNWLEVEINTKILFPSGEAQLVESAIPVLTKVAGVLAPYPNPINVEGFTDNIPISTPEFPSNWELSAARAASVVHLFSKAGVEPSRMSAIAYGEYRPIAPNTTVAGRLKNRRVVIAVLAEDIEKAKLKMQPSKSLSQSKSRSQSAPSSINQRSNTETITF